MDVNHQIFRIKKDIESKQKMLKLALKANAAMYLFK